MEVAFLVVGVAIALAGIVLAVKAKSFSRLNIRGYGINVEGEAAPAEATPIDSLITTVSTLAEELHGLKERVYHLEMEKAVNQQTIRHLNEKVEYLQVQLTSALGERDALRIEIADLRAHIVRLEQQEGN